MLKAGCLIVFVLVGLTFIGPLILYMNLELEYLFGKGPGTYAAEQAYKRQTQANKNCASGHAYRDYSIKEEAYRCS